MGRIKILYIVSTLERTGPTNQLLNIVKYLDRNKFEPIIVTLSAEKQDSRKTEFLGLGIETQSLDLSRVGAFILGPSKLREVVKSNGADIIHANGYRADFLVARYLGDYLRLTTLRGNLLDTYTDTYGGSRGRVMAFVQSRVIGKMNLIVTCSKTMADGIKNKYDNVCAIQNAVDDKIYYPITREQRVEERRKLGLTTDKRIYVAVGSLSRRKDPTTVINGFIASGVYRSGLLIVLGGGPLERACRYITKLHKNILILGQVENVADYLRASDFFISAAISEGLPNAVVEALACGLPVCLSDIKAHSEIVAGREVGVLFSAGDVGNLGRKLEDLLERDYDAIREASLQVARRDFNAAVMSYKYQIVYWRLLAERNNGVSVLNERRLMVERQVGRKGNGVRGIGDGVAM